MKILLGGSPATGSSLLRQMLNRHPDIFCGPELQLFCHPVLFRDWKENRRRLHSKPLLTAPSVHPVKGVNLSGREQSWSGKEVIKLVGRSGSLKEFAEDYFERPLTINNKKYWAEKTPENVLTFTDFLDLWTDGIVIHIVRDPLDTIASLRARGFSLFYAAARYLFNTSHALKSAGHDRYYEIRYEELVTDPVVTLLSLGKRTGINLDERLIRSMLEPGNPVLQDPDKLEGWRSSEIARPNSGSVGRHFDLDEPDQQSSISSLKAVHLTRHYSRSCGLEFATIEEIRKRLGYDLPDLNIEDPVKENRRLRRELRGYRWAQVRNRNLFFEREKPIEIAG